jgi:hypothetical protein
MSNANFRSGSVSHATKAQQMDAYDALPRSVREALANAAFAWAPFPVNKRFQRGQRTARELVKDIHRWDRDQIAKDRTRVWGLPPKPRGSRALNQ